jgi:predicted metal-dependent hydrolase
VYNGWDSLPDILPFIPAKHNNQKIKKKLISFQMQSTDDFQYRIIFSRRRTISIIISPDYGVVVKAPYRTPVASVKRFLNEKSGWIIKTLNGFNSLRRIDNNKGYSDGDSLILYGKEYKLKLYQSDKYAVRIGENNTIEAGYFNDNNPLIIKAMLEGWFKYIAQNKLTAKFSEILLKYKEYGFSPSAFVVRTMKKRWGSCSSKGKIAISYDLIRLDERYAEYVIIHELCHLKHHNHGSNYYKLLSEVYPNWKKVRKELQKYIR